MRRLFNARYLVTSAAVVALSLGGSRPAAAIVYTLSNEASGNQVIAFDIDSRGNVSELGRFATGGVGTGAPLGNQGALATDASDRWLFVVNPGDGTVTTFRLQANGLEFVQRVPSRGFRPISITVFGTLVYVLNEGDGVSADPQMRLDNVSGFRFGPGGLLEPIQDSRRILDGTRRVAPAQVGFNKSGTVLLVTEKATNMITTYVMQPDDTPALAPLKRPSAVPTPFGFEFGDRDFVFITEANGGQQGVTASYRVERDTGAVSAAVDVISQGNATCWTVLSSDQTVGYSTNTADGTVSLYRINFGGTMDYFFSGQNDTPIQTGAGVRDAVLTQNNGFLVTLNNAEGHVRGFWVNRSGAIAPRSTAPVPASATGLIAR